MVAAITEGYPQREIADAAYRYQREFDAGERRVVGVNAYVDEAEVTPVPVLAVPPGSSRNAHGAGWSGPAASATRAPWSRRSPGCATRPARPESSETNLMPHFIRCAAAYATLGEQCARPARGLRRVPRAGLGLTRHVAYDAGMYLDALEFLEEERDAWGPFEALAGLTDEQLERPVDGPTAGPVGISWPTCSPGRRTRSRSPPSSRSTRRARPWRAPMPSGTTRGDVINDEIEAEWAALPMAELRERLATAARASCAAT